MSEPYPKLRALAYEGVSHGYDAVGDGLSGAGGGVGVVRGREGREVPK